jgi:hypothetical protein
MTRCWRHRSAALEIRIATSVCSNDPREVFFPQRALAMPWLQFAGEADVKIDGSIVQPIEDIAPN